MSTEGPSTQKIAYLFNSAVRGTYKENLFRILALPSGCHATLRYSIDQNVKEEILPTLKVGGEVLIVFINRYATGGYEYVPIRRGTIKSRHLDAGKIYIDCELGAYCKAKNIAEFTTALQALSADAPRAIKDDKRDEPNDGQYVLHVASLTDKLDDAFNAWKDNVEHISSTRSFPKDTVAFVRIRIRDANNEKDVKVSENVFINPLKRNYLEILYSDPSDGTKNKHVVVESQDPIILHRSKKRKLGSKSDVLTIPMVSRYRLDQAMSFLTVSVLVDGNDVYSLDVPISIKPWPLLWLAFGVGIVIVGADVMPQFYKDNLELGLTCSIVKWSLLILLMALLGKMPTTPAD